MCCRTHAPAGFPGSVYTWVLRLDQYAVDGTCFVPHWMPKSAGTKAANKKVGMVFTYRIAKICHLMQVKYD